LAPLHDIWARLVEIYEKMTTARMRRRGRELYIGKKRDIGTNTSGRQRPETILYVRKEQAINFWD